MYNVQNAGVFHGLILLTHVLVSRIHALNINTLKPGQKLYEPMVVSLPTHICVTRRQ